ncbi:MAG: TonB-dependent receptor [Pseudomonadota bacterium]
MRPYRSTQVHRLVAATLCLVLGPGSIGLAPLGAQELEEIVVTASLRESQSLLDVPVSVTVLDDELKAGGVQHFQEVMDRVPNLNWSSASNRPRFFQLRGIGERSQYEGAPNPSVGFVVDDIDFSGLGLVGTLFDTERVEVLRGPQGTRYGANALAGLIYVQTAAPSFDPHFDVRATGGTEGTLGLGVSAGGALDEGNTAAWRVALEQFENNGFRDNDFFPADDTNRRDELSARARLRWLPSDRLTLDLTLMLADIDNGFDAFAPENTFVVHSDDPGRDAQRSLGGALRAVYRGSAMDFTSITSVADSDIVYTFDGDWGNDRYWGEFAPYDFTSATLRDRQTLSQEFRLASTGAGPRRWVGGVYLLDLDEDNRFNDFFNDEVFRDLSSNFESTSIALFGELDQDLSDRDTLTLGLRLEQRSADYSDTGGVSASPDDTMVGGQLSWVRQLSDASSSYVTLARGYKAGGFNLGLSVPEERREFEPEYLWNLEAGIRGRWLDGRARGSLSVFVARRDDMQVGTSFQADPTDPLTFVFFTDNASSGRNMGLELEGEYRINDRWRADLALGLLDTRFEDFQSPQRTLDGRDQAHAPGYQFALGLNWESEQGYYARFEVTGRDDFFFSDSHDQRSQPYELVNVNLGYASDRWSVELWGRNVTDEEYATRGFFFGLEPPDFPDRLYTQLGDPAVFGLTATWRM